MAKYYVTIKVEGRYTAEVEADSIEKAKELGMDEFRVANLNETEIVDSEAIIVEDEEDIVWEA